MYPYLFNSLRAASYSWGSCLIGTKYSSPDMSQLTGIHCIGMRHVIWPLQLCVKKKIVAEVYVGVLSDIWNKGPHISQTTSVSIVERELWYMDWWQKTVVVLSLMTLSQRKKIVLLPVSQMLHRAKWTVPQPDDTFHGKTGITTLPDKLYRCHLDCEFMWVIWFQNFTEWSDLRHRWNWKMERLSSSTEVVIWQVV
jgi:hypothetical protein